MIIPLFIDVKLNISPGVVSTILSIFWMIFISILTKILVKKAYIDKIDHNYILHIKILLISQTVFYMIWLKV